MSLNLGRSRSSTNGSQDSLLKGVKHEVLTETFKGSKIDENAVNTILQAIASSQLNLGQYQLDLASANNDALIEKIKDIIKKLYDQQEEDIEDLTTEVEKKISDTSESIDTDKLALAVLDKLIKNKSKLIATETKTEVIKETTKELKTIVEKPTIVEKTEVKEEKTKTEELTLTSDSSLYAELDKKLDELKTLFEEEQNENKKLKEYKNGEYTNSDVADNFANLQTYVKTQFDQINQTINDISDIGLKLLNLKSSDLFSRMNVEFSKLSNRIIDAFNVQFKQLDDKISLIRIPKTIFPKIDFKLVLLKIDSSAKSILAKISSIKFPLQKLPKTTFPKIDFKLVLLKIDSSAKAILAKISAIKFPLQKIPKQILPKIDFKLVLFKIDSSAKKLLTAIAAIKIVDTNVKSINFKDLYLHMQDSLGELLTSIKEYIANIIANVESAIKTFIAKISTNLDENISYISEYSTGIFNNLKLLRDEILSHFKNLLNSLLFALLELSQLLNAFNGDLQQNSLLLLKTIGDVKIPTYNEENATLIIQSLSSNANLIISNIDIVLDKISNFGNTILAIADKIAANIENLKTIGTDQRPTIDFKQIFDKIDAIGNIIIEKISSIKLPETVSSEVSTPNINLTEVLEKLDQLQIDFSKKIDNLEKTIKDEFSKFKPLLWISLLNFGKKMLASVPTLFKTIGTKIAALSKGFLSLLAKPFKFIETKIVDLGKGIWTKLSKSIKGIGTTIANLGIGLWNKIKAPFKGLGSKISTLGKGLWSKISSPFKNLGSKISGLGKGLMNKIKAPFKGLGEKLGKIGGQLKNGFVSVVKGVGGAVKSLGIGLLKGIGGVFSALNPLRFFKKKKKKKSPEEVKLSKMIDKVNDFIDNFFDRMMSYVDKFLDRVLKSAKKIVNKLMTHIFAWLLVNVVLIGILFGFVLKLIADPLMKILQPIMDFIERTISNLLEFLTPIRDFLLNVFKKAWEIVSAPLEAFFKGIASVAEALATALGKLVIGIADFFVDTLLPFLRDKVLPVFGSVLDIIKEFFDAIKPWIKPLVDTVLGILQTFLEAIKPWIEPLVNTVMRILVTILEIVEEFFKAIKPWINPIVNHILGILDTVLDILQKVLTEVGEIIISIVKIIKAPIKFLADFFEGLGSKAKEIGTKMGDIVLKVLTKIEWALDNLTTLVRLYVIAPLLGIQRKLISLMVKLAENFVIPVPIINFNDSIKPWKWEFKLQDMHPFGFLTGGMDKATIELAHVDEGKPVSELIADEMSKMQDNIAAEKQALEAAELAKKLLQALIEKLLAKQDQIGDILSYVKANKAELDKISQNMGLEVEEVNLQQDQEIDLSKIEEDSKKKVSEFEDFRKSLFKYLSDMGVTMKTNFDLVIEKLDAKPNLLPIPMMDPSQGNMTMMEDL